MAGKQNTAGLSPHSIQSHSKSLQQLSSVPSTSRSIPSVAFCTVTWLPCFVRFLTEKCPSPVSQENQTGLGGSSTAFLWHQMRPQRLLLLSLPFSGRRAQSPAVPEPSSLILVPQPPSREVPTHSCAAPPSAGICAGGRRGWQRRCPTSPSWCSPQSPRHPAGKGHWATQPGSLWRAGQRLHQPGVPVPCPTLPRLGRTQGLSLWDENKQSLPLPHQHLPGLISTRAPPAPASSDTAQGSHARLIPPLPPGSLPPTHKHSHRGAQHKRTHGSTHQVDEGAPRVPKLRQRRERRV